MNLFSTSSFSRRPGATVAGIFCMALGSTLLLCGAGSVPVENFLPQGAMQGDLNAGNYSITNAATVNATNFAGNGSGLTNLTGSSVNIYQGLLHVNMWQRGGYLTGTERIRMAYSSLSDPAHPQELNTLNTYNPPTSGDGLRDPSLTKTSTGRYLIASTVSKSGGLEKYVDIAGSRDLINWQHIANLAPSNGTDSFSVPRWITDPATGKLYLLMQTTSADVLDLVENTSKDGVSWGTPIPITVSGGGSVTGTPFDCQILPVGSTYHLYYSRQSDSTFQHWTSSSLASGYTQVGHITQIDGAEGCWVTQTPTGFIAYFHEGGGAGPEAYSTSTDGTTWTTATTITVPPVSNSSPYGPYEDWDNGGNIPVADAATALDVARVVVLNPTAVPLGPVTFLNGGGLDVGVNGNSQLHTGTPYIWSDSFTNLGIEPGGNSANFFLNSKFTGNLFINKQGGQTLFDNLSSSGTAVVQTPSLRVSNVTSGIPKTDSAGTFSKASENVDYGGAFTLTSNTTGTITFNTGGHSETIYNTSSSTISSATLTLPSTATSGQILRYETHGAITTLTMAGQTVDGWAGPGSLTADSSIVFQAESANGHFVRIQ